MAKVVIKSDGIIAHIFVDGVEVKDVRGYRVEHTVCNCPIVHLELVATECENDMEDAFVKMTLPVSGRGVSAEG